MFKYKRPKITTTTLKKKEPNWRANIIYFKEYYKVMIIKIMLHWGKKIDTLMNGTEQKLEID